MNLRKIEPSGWLTAGRDTLARAGDKYLLNASQYIAPAVFLCRMLSAIDYNTVFQLAADYINFSNRSLFLTGKAGTGKTTFLKFIRENTSKELAVLAPTGVAAINAGGTTIHSFFQLPFGPYVPGSATGEAANDEYHLLGKLRYTSEKIQLLRGIELLIIDEISMVRSDILDEIDLILRHYRDRRHEPFGGVQVLFIGDMYQLPPVAADDEWKILSQFYNSPYFFDSRVIQDHPPLYIELEKIYRQSDMVFVGLLNRIRNNELDSETSALLHSRYLPLQQHEKNSGSITLTTHNYLADHINATELQHLQEELFTFKATITGDFYEKSFPAEEELKLKVGAQVMFLKNDMEKSRRYFNGKIGVVQKIAGEKVWVQSPGEEPLEVETCKWENIRYSFNADIQRVEEVVLGSFEQFPLRLAWAITIHKSQGLTFQKAVIDAGGSFAPGQVYVALSRCTSLEGIILHSPISQRALLSDERINRFTRRNEKTTDLPSELLHAKHQYQESVLTGVFDFSRFIIMSEELMHRTEAVKTSFNENTMLWLQQLIVQIEGMQNVAQKFQPQLQGLLEDPALPENNSALQQRIKAAAKYFTKELESVLQTIVGSPAVTASYLHAKEYTDLLKDLHTAVAFKLHMIKTCAQGFTFAEFNSQKKSFKAPSFHVTAYSKVLSQGAKNIAHPQLYKQLKTLRDEICNREKLSVYFVAGSKTLEEMTRYLPQTKEELIAINGFGRAKVEKYGGGFLKIITAYCAAHELGSQIDQKILDAPPKERAEPKTDTKFESLKLHRDGKSIIEIAAMRSLAVSTIETHLAYYVKTGEVKIEELVPVEKIASIASAMNNMEERSIGSLKEKLGPQVSYGEIKLVMASQDYRVKQTVNRQ